MNFHKPHPAAPAPSILRPGPASANRSRTPHLEIPATSQAVAPVAGFPEGIQQPSARKLVKKCGRLGI